MLGWHQHLALTALRAQGLNAMKPLNKYLNVEISTKLATIATMSNHAVGAYHRLELFAAQHGGIVPADEAKLRMISRCNPRDWKRYRDEILSAIEPVEGDYLIADAATSEERYKEKSAEGTAKAKARWNKDGSHGRNTISCANPLKSLNGTMPNGKEQITKSIDIEDIDPETLSDLGGRPEEPALQPDIPNSPSDGRPASSLSNGTPLVYNMPTVDPPKNLRPAVPSRRKCLVDYNHGDWRYWLDALQKQGRWSDYLGPRPGEEGCLVPKELMH
jgi:hypothetical protein